MLGQAMRDSEGSHTPETPGTPSARSEAKESKTAEGRSPRRRTQLPEETSLEGLPKAGAAGERAPSASKDAGSSEVPRRPSVLDALRQSRTTVYEVGKVAQRLSLVALGLADARHVVRQLVISFVAGLALALMVALVFAGGTLRLVLGILAGTCVTALGVFCTLRLVSKLAQRFGARSLPGSPWLWVSGIVLLAVSATAGLSYSIWEVTKVATATRLRAAPTPRKTLVAPKQRADAKMKRGVHIGLHKGVLYAPPKFESADGQFDLMLHYHGNSQLVEESVAAAGLNALVAIINVGDGADKYSRYLQNPYVFDRELTTIEKRAAKQLRLENAQIRRIAVSAWSAGFASVSQILSSRSRLDRVDAVFLLDAPHAKFAPGGEHEVYAPSLEHFLAFARRAMTGQKLMVITHSAIKTEGYPSTTRTIDALLEHLALERKLVSAGGASPPPVDLPVAKRAFPTGERNWLNVVSEAHANNLHVYGCTGEGKGDHIAHLAQMSVTVLPRLRERWK